MPARATIDPDKLPKHFDAAEAEKRFDARWQELGVYHYDPTRSREDTWVVDTPPPTTSGSLHIGHVFSYTQPDFITRYQRMRGKSIYYPMGWDDNGVPTERRAQNLFHVRCDPTLPRDPGLALEPATSKTRSGPYRVISRPDFIALCARVTAADEKAFLEVWRRVGLSIDWRTEYATIDEQCRRIAQLSFWDLHRKGHVYQSDAPFMWDVDFQMAVAQAEVEDKLRPGAYHDIEFGVEGGGAFTISTTRPELLAACVGVTAHPDDARYQGLFGKRAITPLFHAPVSIFASEKADPEKGTGILMVCTFGDQTDVEWWRDHKLPLRQVLGKNGRLLPVTFGGEAFPSLDAEAANRAYAEIAGRNLKQARARTLELLRDTAGSATGGGAPLVREPRPIEHAVRFYEKGDSPLEFLPTRQWFVRLLDKKEALLAKGAEIAWHPEHMHKRFEDWTRNLGFDWCISRQRYFGVPIPVWYPLDAAGRPDYARPIVADPKSLPVDPMTDAPPGHQEAQRGQPGGFAGEADVFDTWFTSSMTPQIASRWLLEPERHARLFPADLRPQAHDIIRTWAFYTIAKALLHEDRIPWRRIAISGWILDPDRKKMSKSVGNVMTPMEPIEKHGADAIRYWAGSARLGVDTAIDENVWKVGRRLVTKLFNASKFALAQTAEPGPIATELDRAFVAELQELVAHCTAAYEKMDYARALEATESFFWRRFTDTYLELAKARARSESDPAGRASAVATLRLALSVLVRLFAPVLPYITEEIWSWAFAAETGRASVHVAAWPSTADFAGISAPADAASFETAVASFLAINKAKADANVSAGRETLRLALAAEPATRAKLVPVMQDVLAAARCAAHTLADDAALEPGAIAVRDAVFAERSPAEA
ncbi:MAG TPA: valine--tRNA ligase [Myxococcota bacterium]